MIYYIGKTRRPYRLAVRTAPSHGANSGSSPDKVTSNNLNRTPRKRVDGLGCFILCGDLILRNTLSRLGYVLLVRALVVPRLARIT